MTKQEKKIQLKGPKKSIIRLDKNFHIYIHGDRNLIEKGQDEKGKFYKIYFKESDEQ